MPSAARKGKGKAQTELKTEAALPLGKQLAHTDKKIRDQAVKNLAAFLSRGGVDEDGDADLESSTAYVRLSDAEMAKLWKGLFYCFWMSDKPLVQQALATDLAGLLLKINPELPSTSVTPREASAERFRASLAFLEGFWLSIIREWNGIDRLRMDKFYMLIRRFVNATFRLLARDGWRADGVNALNSFLSGATGPLSWETRALPSSIQLHLSDIYLDELEKVLSTTNEDESSPACPLPEILKPFITLLTRTPGSNVHSHLMSSLFIPLLAGLKSSTEGDDDESRPVKRRKGDSKAAHAPAYPSIAAHSSATVNVDGDAKADGASTVRKALLKAMFVAAADAKAVESNRRKVYKVWREEGGDDDDEE